MKSEKWEPVAGFESLYAVSDQGRVKSFDRTINRKDGSIELKKGRIMKPSMSAYGYQILSLCDNGKRTTAIVHRLVAMAFLGASNGRHVNHIDFNRTNNSVNNLEWVTPKENTAHSIRSGRWNMCHKGETALAINNPKRASKLTASDVAEIRAACAAGEYQYVIAKRYGILQGTVSKIKRGATWGNEVRHGSRVTSENWPHPLTTNQ